MKEVAMIRLIAEEGKVLTNGKVQGKVIDVCPVEDKSKWSEIDEPIPVIEPETDIPTPEPEIEPETTE